MKKHYDFNKGKRGAIILTQNKIKITIRLDSNIIEWFKAKVTQSRGGNYQSLINKALHEYIDHQGESLETLLRKVIREELQS